MSTHASLAPTDPNSGSGPASFAEHYQTGEYAAFDQEHRRGGTFGLTMVDVVQDAGEFTDPGMPEFAIAAGRNDAVPSEYDFGDGWRTNVGRKGWVDIQPANTECRFRLPDVELRAVTIGEQAFIEQLGESSLMPNALNGVSGRMRHLPHAARLIDQMWHAAAAPGPATNLLLDGAFLQLVGTLLAACGDERGLAPVAAIGDARLARAIDYIETHLAEPLTVGEIAAVAAMSPSHFARSFKSATGEAVWAFVMRRRTERAREMVARTDLSQAIVAHRCGFSDAGHLRRALRRR